MDSENHADTGKAQVAYQLMLNAAISPNSGGLNGRVMHLNGRATGNAGAYVGFIKQKILQFGLRIQMIRLLELD